MLADPVLELHGPGAFATITNDNWRQTQEAEIQATGIPPTNNFESAIDATLAPGAYTAIVRGNGNTSGVALVEVYDLNQGVDSKLANISTRAFVSTGDNIVIAGFTLGGNSSDDRIVVRGIGPSLTAMGLPNALANPTLELRDRMERYSPQLRTGQKARGGRGDPPGGFSHQQPPPCPRRHLLAGPPPASLPARTKTAPGAGLEEASGGGAPPRPGLFYQTTCFGRAGKKETKNFLLFRTPP